MLYMINRKTILFGLPLVLLMTGCSVQHAPEAAKESSAPRQTVEETSVRKTALLPPFKAADYAGKVVLVDVWAAWSDQCKAELPVLRGILDAHQDDAFALVGLAVENKDEAAAVATIQAMGLPYPVSFASDAVPASLADVRALPTRLLLDKKGVVRKQYAGLLPEQQVRADVAALLAE